MERQVVFSFLYLDACQSRILSTHRISVFFVPSSSHPIIHSTTNGWVSLVSLLFSTSVLLSLAGKTEHCPSLSFVSSVCRNLPTWCSGINRGIHLYSWSPRPQILCGIDSCFLISLAGFYPVVVQHEKWKQRSPLFFMLDRTAEACSRWHQKVKVQ